MDKGARLYKQNAYPPSSALGSFIPAVTFALGEIKVCMGVS